MATQIALKRRVKRQDRKPLGKTWESAPKGAQFWTSMGETAGERDEKEKRRERVERGE